MRKSAGGSVCRVAAGQRSGVSPIFVSRVNYVGSLSPANRLQHHLLDEMRIWNMEGDQRT